MEVTKIQGSPREERGRNQVARLRADGKVPAVAYGLGKETAHLSLDEEIVERELRKHHRVFELALGGSSESVYLQDVQYDTLTDRCLHIDFLRIDMNQPMPVEVELTFLGIPAGAARGGQLVRDTQRIGVLALPASIPHEIEIKVSALDIGDELLAKDLKMPEGVTLADDGDTLICHVAE